MQIWLVGWGYKIRLSIKAVMNCRHNCLGFTKEHNKCLICKGTGVAVAWCPVFRTGLLGSSGFLIFYVAKKKAQWFYCCICFFFRILSSSCIKDLTGITAQWSQVLILTITVIASTIKSIKKHFSFVSLILKKKDYACGIVCCCSFVFVQVTNWSCIWNEC